MDESRLLYLMADLHREGDRQGPGSDIETLRALDLSRLGVELALEVADIGCGTGASTLVLAATLQKARITAIDLLPDFLERLTARAAELGLANRITTCQGVMESLPFAQYSLDLIWAEGAVYNMGFAAGVTAWQQYLKPGGILAVSEITWLRPDPPAPIREYWESEYPEIATAAEKILVLERAGYDMMGYFSLPSSSWLANYYQPTERRIDAFLERHGEDPDAIALIEMERKEHELYRHYQAYYSYGFYVARKR